MIRMKLPISENKPWIRSIETPSDFPHVIVGTCKCVWYIFVLFLSYNLKSQNIDSIQIKQRFQMFSNAFLVYIERYPYQNNAWDI